VGQHNKEYFRRLGLTDSQLVWAPHAVDNDRFADPNGEHAAEALRWRREIGIDDDRAALLFAGKLDSGKAPDLLLDAFLRRQLAGADEHLLFVGSGALEDVLRRAARGARNVHFLGFQNQSRMPIVYRCGDVFALPSSRSETWGLAVNEAMASGRPVIVSDQVGCAPDLVEGRSGFVVPAGNVDAIEQALNRLFEDRSLRTRLGERASVHIQSWSLIEQARRIEHAVRHHLEGRTGPAAP
jgi:glycosyltransferase involved in cell wall biosynthesis